MIEINWTITIICFLISWEIIYLIICRNRNKKEIEELWGAYKFISFIINMDIYGLLYLINIKGKVTLIMIGSILVIVLFFYLNKKIGIAVAKKR